MKNCILFLYDYPFLKTEWFMESEINYLSKAFESITIFSINAKNNFPLTRKIPSNVKAFALNCPNKKPINILRGLFNRSIYKLRGSNLKRTLANAYTRGRMGAVASRAFKILKRNKLMKDDTIIYTYWFNQPIASLILKRNMIEEGFKNINCVSRAHGYDLYAEINPISYIPFQQNYINDLDYVIPISQNGFDYINKKFIVKRNNVVVSRLGVRKADKTQMRFESGKITFVTCSRLVKVKRVDLFAKAFSIIVEKYPKATWTCIGDGEEKDDLIALLNSLNITNSVILTGALPNTEIYKTYEDNYYSYFVNVSSSEGVPVSIMEAMAFGIPVIATNVGGTSEIVSSKNGKLVDANITPELLADSIIKELESIDPMKRENSLNTWKDKCDADRNYKNWTEFLKHL
ncbi:MAG: glycosyltransferase [Erysipelotrichaceae bacterium]|jgi:glycosyltransferase involved in cell wall biosynthesis|nr:glycosyltransferase [Erysipelotrichaceae bacterium]